MKKFLTIIAVLVFVGIIIKLFTKTDNEQVQTVTAVAEVKKSEPTEAELIAKEIEQLNNSLYAIKNFMGSNYRGDMNLITFELDFFSDWAKKCRSQNYNTNDSVRFYREKVTSALRALQLKEFPAMRKNYGKISASKLWESNIEVAVFGTGNTTIQFTGGIFANNANKQEFQTSLNKIFHRLRFKKSIYKWYKYDEEYTYYEISSANDGDIVSE